MHEIRAGGDDAAGVVADTRSVVPRGEEAGTDRSALAVAGGAAAAAAAAVLVGASAGGPGPAGKSGSSARVVLDLAVTEAPGKPAGVIADAFARRVSALSHGSVAVSVSSWPTRLGSRASAEEVEADAVRAVRRDEVQLAVIPSHALEAEGVGTLRALQAPFVVATAPLAARATTGSIARRLESGLAAISLTGLALVPESLERPFGFLKPLVTPADFAGVRIRADSSPATRAALRALGARPLDLDDAGSDTAVYSGFVNDAESLPRADDEFPVDAYTTGDVALFPRVDAVVGSTGALAKLRPAQRAILLRAAAEARAETLRRTSERAAAAAFCRAGGTVVLASAAERRALQAKVAPLLARLRARPGHRSRSSPGSSGSGRAAGRAPGPAARRHPGLRRRRTTTTTRRLVEARLRPPPGSYRRSFAADELRAAGADEDDARDNAGVTTLTFFGPPWSLRFELDWQGTLRPPCRGRVDFTRHRAELRWNPTTPCSGFVAFRWTRDSEGDLTLFALDPRTQPRWRSRAYAGVWKQVDCVPNGGWPGPPPARRPAGVCRRRHAAGVGLRGRNRLLERRPARRLRARPHRRAGPVGRGRRRRRDRAADPEPPSARPLPL